jgi:hypothetical protein
MVESPAVIADDSTHDRGMISVHPSTVTRPSGY